jgi:uncharacterized membrane protein YfcA
LAPPYAEDLIRPEVVVTRIGRRVFEVLALAVTLVAGYLYLDELGRVRLFWILAAVVAVMVVGWHGRRHIRRMLRRPR